MGLKSTPKKMSGPEISCTGPAHTNQRLTGLEVSEQSLTDSFVSEQGLSGTVQNQLW